MAELNTGNKMLYLREFILIHSKPNYRHFVSRIQFSHIYLDLYLLHWPVRLRKGHTLPPKEEDFLPLDIKSTWQGMEKCFELGLTKAIGVSNFSCKKIEDLLKYAKIPPAANQVEMHPMWQQKKLREYCSKMKIEVCAWSPLGAPKTPWGSNTVMDNPVIKEIAQKHGMSIAQVYTSQKHGKSIASLSRARI
ncbi:deoxymugineic acid synthase 1-like [Cryptomeria japonica]|uniref:deoxymugineic acid synthase 1-like n=1 Tax=Cryptomeria japonica TaxID=3369 RepID=UPI0027DA98C5|nr:deoxymugineic acid synthase 1-like [Cryptomeria japonica]